MAKYFFLYIIFAKLAILKCDQSVTPEKDSAQESSEVKTVASYSYGYGVTDISTGDVKTVYEEKNGDSVKGSYSVLDPGGSLRTVKYSAEPNKGFKASVESENLSIKSEEEGRSFADKSFREFGKLYDFPDNMESDEYVPNERKRSKHPFDTLFKDYSLKKRPKYPLDLEPSEYTHSLSIKHPQEDYSAQESESHTHVHFDPSCKKKHKKEHYNDLPQPYGSSLYNKVVEFDLSKKYPLIPGFSDSYKSEMDRIKEASSFDLEKIPFDPFNLANPYKFSKIPEPLKSLAALKQRPFYDADNYPVLPDMPIIPDKYGEDLLNQRLKKRNKHKHPELNYPVDDLDDYILVPKKRLKKPHNPYRPDEDEYDGDEYQDDRRTPTRESAPKEIVKKIVKKRRPGFNLLDILDI